MKPDELHELLRFPQPVPALHQAMAGLREAIALIDSQGVGNANLGIAAAHAESALLLLENEIDPVPQNDR